MLVDAATDPGMEALWYDPTRGLVIGAQVSCSRIHQDGHVLAHYPCLVMVARLIDSACPRGTSSLGCQVRSDTPHGDALPALVVLGATCRIAGPRGERAVSLEQLCAPGDGLALGEGEHLVSLHLPAAEKPSGAWYIPFHPGADMALVHVRVAAALTLSDDGSVIERACVAVGEGTKTARCLDEVSAVLQGLPPALKVFNAAGVLARLLTASEQERSVASAERAHLMGLLTNRALRVAYIQAVSRPREDDVALSG